MIKRNTIVTGFSIMPRHKELITHFIEDKGTFKSASEVVQRAIEFFHDKTYPDYIYNKSATDVLKREKLSTKKSLDEMSDLDYAKDVIGALVIGDKIIMHWFSNTIEVRPLAGCKDFFSNNTDIVENHRAINALNPIEKEIHSPNGSQVLSRAGVVIPNEEIPNE